MVLSGADVVQGGALQIMGGRYVVVLTSGLWSPVDLGSFSGSAVNKLCVFGQMTSI